MGESAKHLTKMDKMEGLERKNGKKGEDRPEKRGGGTFLA
jgi:hypothetical protein